MGKRIMFTGGSGKAGRHVVQYLVERGHQVLNIDSKPLDNPEVRTLITDITDSGQVFNAFTSYMGLHEFDPSLRAQPVDAVVHFAAIPRIMITPDNELFRVNTMGTYNVIEAAVKLGIKKVIVASSETTYGVVFANEPKDPAYFPLDEEYDVDPMDSTRSPRSSTRRPRGRLRSGAASTSTRCASATSSSRTNTRATSRNGSRIRPSASALPGATSTRATSARSSISALPRTASATRSSTPPTTIRRRR